MDSNLYMDSNGFRNSHMATSIQSHSDEEQEELKLSRKTALIEAERETFELDI